MKRPAFITLVLSHSIFFFFVFLIYFLQDYQYDFLAADSMAHVYAASLFIPNAIALFALYSFYVFWIFLKAYKKEKVSNLFIHLAYIVFFVLGFLVIFSNFRSVKFCDNFFVATQFIAISLASFMIIKTKNKRGYAARIF